MFDQASAVYATEIVQNSTFERFARTGYVVSGLLHLTIGYLAIRIALGSGVGDADQSGALSAVAAQPGGIVALWVAVFAFLVMALWRLVETAVGRSTDPKSQRAASEVLDRAKAFALAVVYFALAYSTLGFARGAGKSTGEQNSDISARLMQTGAGTARAHSRRSRYRRGRRISHLQGSQTKISRRPQGQVQRPGAAIGHSGLHRQRPDNRRGRNTGNNRGQSYRPGERRPVSTAP